MTTSSPPIEDARIDAHALAASPAGILVPGGAALERVAGVEIAARAAIVLRRTGCQRVSLVASPEVRARLEVTERAGALGSEATFDADCIVVIGDVAFSASLVDAVRSAGRAAFAACPSGLVFAGPGALATDLVREHQRAGLGASTAWAGSRAVLVEPGELLDASTPQQRVVATRQILRATAKSADGPLTRLFERRVSQAISSMLLPLSVSPNVMTSVSLAVGVAGATLLAASGYGLRVLGAALFVLATIIDGCDGEIARAKLLESRFGKLYDTAVDIAVNALVFVGIAVGTWRELGGAQEVRLAGALLVGGGLLAMAAVEGVRRLARTPPQASILGRSRRWLEWFATVEWSYLVLALALVDQLPFFFFGAAVGANVFAAVYLTLGVLAWRRA